MLLLATSILLLFSSSPMAAAGPTQVTSLIHHSQQYNNMQQNANLNSSPYTTAAHALLLDLRQQMINRALKFDEHFRSLLSSSKLNLHNMFMDTYGIMYARNTEIFTSMYESLEQYYATGQTKLTKSMESFFERLYQRIFQVYNQHRVFSPRTLECATEQLAHLRPFKDAPDKLIEEIRHAFVAARTFNQALNSGIDIMKNIISLGQPTQCTNLINDKLIRNSVPSEGQGASRVPCMGFCEQVMSRCIGRENLEQLNERWRTYVLALGDLAKKLSVHYNIENIIAPLDVQISEAIMNFQENAHNITQQVVHACSGADGQPKQQQQHFSNQNRLGKRAAAANAISPAMARTRQPAAIAPVSLQHAANDFHAAHDTTYTPTDGHARATSRFGANVAHNTNSNNNNNNTPRQSGQLAAPDGNRIQASKRPPSIIDEIRDFLLSTRTFWSSLPNSICSSNYTNIKSSGAGPLGTLIGQTGSSQLSTRRSNGHQPATCFQEPLTLADMNSDLRYRIEIQQQVSRLDVMHSKIVDALSGNEIDWSSNESKQTVVAPTPVIAGGQQQLSANAPVRPTQISTTSSAPPPDPSAIGDDDPSGDPEDLVPREPGSGEDNDDPDDPDVLPPDPDDDPHLNDDDLEDEPIDPDDETNTSRQPASTDSTTLDPEQNLSPDQNQEQNELEKTPPNGSNYLSNEIISVTNQNAQKSGSAARIQLDAVSMFFGFSIPTVVALSIVINFRQAHDRRKV